MLRDIHLYGSLAKAAGESTFQLEVDTQKQLFTALSRRSPALDMALRKAKEVVVVTPNADGVTGQCIEPGFSFGKRSELHIAENTEGGYVSIPYIVEAVIAIVVAVAVAYISAALMGKNNANGSGGAKSTMFNGPVNNTDQGGGIPLVYGKKVLVGSTIISVDEDYYNQTGITVDSAAPTSTGFNPHNIPNFGW